MVDVTGPTPTPGGYSNVSLRQGSTQDGLAEGSARDLAEGSTQDLAEGSTQEGQNPAFKLFVTDDSVSNNNENSGTGNDNNEGGTGYHSGSNEGNDNGTGNDGNNSGSNNEGGTDYNSGSNEGNDTGHNPWATTATTAIAVGGAYATANTKAVQNIAEGARDFGKGAGKVGSALDKSAEAVISVKESKRMFILAFLTIILFLLVVSKF